MSALTLGVVGTLVWDRFVERDESVVVEDWGGIAYALSALAAALPAGWSVLPIVKVGSDVVGDARRFLADLPGIDSSAIVEVPEPNNRVEIRYQTASRRTERLIGGVPSWSWDELDKPVRRCDALYVNFISGFEMDLDTALRLASGFGGASYADLHSLFLGKDEDGLRIPLPLQSVPDWLRCFDAVQMNEDELELWAGPDDPWRQASDALGRRPKLIAVTGGERGSAYVSIDPLESDPLCWNEPRTESAAEPAAGQKRVDTGRGRIGTVAVPTEPRTGDPTGCGDVWGAATFARLLAGDSIVDAMAEGNRLGGLNVEHRGTTGLVEHLTRAHAHQSARDEAPVETEGRAAREIA